MTFCIYAFIISFGNRYLYMQTHSKVYLYNIHIYIYLKFKQSVYPREKVMILFFFAPFNLLLMYWQKAENLEKILFMFSRFTCKDHLTGSMNEEQ